MIRSEYKRNEHFSHKSISDNITITLEQKLFITVYTYNKAPL